jgi:hypothetical protein
MPTGNNNSQEVYSQSVKAGRRTYFFDVKKTLNNDFFVTFTESKKNTKDGKEEFVKHKIFIYKEDFDKVLDGLVTALDFAKSKIQESTNSSSTEVNFEDL